MTDARTWVSVVGSLVVAFLLGPTPAVAQPAVCDGLAGDAYQHCNDFCEALDCDWDLNASETQCEALRAGFFALTGVSEFPCEAMSLGCVTGDSGVAPPQPFDVGDGNNYGSRVLELTVPAQCECNGTGCTPCPIVAGFHGYGESGDGWRSWKYRLTPKGAAVGFISLYPTGDSTQNTYGTGNNWAVPSCQDPTDGCLNGAVCDWCGASNEDSVISTQREIDFTRAIVKWTMDNHCVDPGQIFATGYSNGALWSHELARNPGTSKLFKALVPIDGVDQAGLNDHLKWIHAPPDGDSPWVLHVNEIFDKLEPYDGRTYDFSPFWIYPPVLQVFAEYQNNSAYSACGFGPNDVGDRFGAFAAGGVVPNGYRRLDGPDSLEGEGQDKFYCFTKDAIGDSCEKLAICLLDSKKAGDDRDGSTQDPHARAGREWRGGTEPGTGGTKPMDIMWRFMQASVGSDGDDSDCAPSSDCGGGLVCEDPLVDCGDDTCNGANKASCSSDADCCSGNCKGGSCRGGPR